MPTKDSMQERYEDMKSRMPESPIKKEDLTDNAVTNAINEKYEQAKEKVNELNGVFKHKFIVCNWIITLLTYFCKQV